MVTGSASTCVSKAADGPAPRSAMCHDAWCASPAQAMGEGSSHAAHNACASSGRVGVSVRVGTEGRDETPVDPDLCRPGDFDRRPIDVAGCLEQRSGSLHVRELRAETRDAGHGERPLVGGGETDHRDRPLRLLGMRREPRGTLDCASHRR